MIIKILNKMNLSLGKCFPRHSVRFAMKYFKGNQIEVIEIGTYKGFNALNMI